MYFCEYFTFEPLLAFLIIYPISFLYVTSYDLVSRLFVYYFVAVDCWIHTYNVIYGARTLWIVNG